MKTSDNTIKKILISQRKEYQRYLGAMSEDYQSKLSGVAELVLSTKDEVITLKGDMEIVKGDVNVLKGDMEIVKGDVNVLKGDMEIIKDDLNIIKNSLRQKVDLGDFVALEKRVIFLEKKITKV